MGIQKAAPLKENMRKCVPIHITAYIFWYCNIAPSPQDLIAVLLPFFIPYYIY